ncbi:histidine-type phosphatase [Mucilaginibacter sp. AW1-3]
MNKLIFCSLALILASCTVTFAQNCDDAYWGTKTLYQPQQKKYAPVPPGYKPVFINYVGRHGARHLTKDVNTTLAYKLLQKADSAKALKPDGKKLEAMVVALQKVEQPYLKSISIRGAEEQQGIGARMRLHNAAVFADDRSCLNIIITKEERTKQSSEAFLKGLGYKGCVQPIKVDNDALRFFSIAPAYLQFEENGSWKQQMDKLEKAVKPAGFDIRFLNRFFDAGFVSQLKTDEQDEFIDDILGFSSITNSVSAEIKNAGYRIADLNFRSLIICDELRVLDELNGADEFLKKGPAMDSNGIQVRDAVPLLVNFINTTDKYIAHQNTAAELRFAHAETIAPFAALLGLNGAGTPAKNILQYAGVWQTSKVIPLSANIQMVMLKNNRNNYLIKFLLNEKEVAIGGLATKTFPYYQWANVRSFYLNKLTKLHVGLTDDMHAYLINLQ